MELRKNLLEAQKQHVRLQAAASRAGSRETLMEYVKGHPSLTLQFGLRLFLLSCTVRSEKRETRWDMG